jgi:UDP-N-acetylenolpyruvoylglucosamine reductase
MEAVQTRVEHPTFETVWAALQELTASQKETDRIIKENAREIGKLGNRFGEMVESMVVPNLVQKFKKLGFEFEKAYKDAVIKDEENHIFTEVDITLENGDKVMLVEVKSKPKTEDVTEHIERMEKVKFHSNIHGDKRKYLGAIAGMVFNDNEKEFALKCGLYVIEPSGETFIITAPEGKYAPREW